MNIENKQKIVQEIFDELIKRGDAKRVLDDEITSLVAEQEKTVACWFNEEENCLDVYFNGDASEEDAISCDLSDEEFREIVYKQVESHIMNTDTEFTWN